MGNSAGAAVDLGTILRCEPSNSPAQQLLDQIRSQAAPPAPGSTNKSSASLPHPPLAAATAQPPVLAHVPAVESSAAFDAQKLKQRAQQLLGDGLNDKVIALLAQYLRTVDKPPFSQLLQSDQTSLLHLLATAYSSTEDYQHAVAVQETILRLDPTNFRALYKRAENQLQLATQVSIVSFLLISSALCIVLNLYHRLFH